MRPMEEGLPRYLTLSPVHDACFKGNGSALQGGHAHQSPNALGTSPDPARKKPRQRPHWHCPGNGPLRGRKQRARAMAVSERWSGI